MPTSITVAAELTNLTEEALAGVGVFDTLMRSTKLHLQDEYDAQRITGHEYATVYLGALTAVLQTSAQFLVNVQQEQLINAQIDQIRALILKTQADVINDNARTANDNTRTANETTKTTAEIAAIQANTVNTTNNVASEILLRAGQLTNDTTRTTNDTAKTNAEITAVTARTSNDTLKTSEEITASQSRTVNETNKVTAEVALLAGQLVNDTTRTTNDTTRTANESAKTAAENTILYARGTAEVSLLEQKTATEIANVYDTIPAGIGLVSGTVAGVTGKQKALYTAQADGFQRDAEQKLAKILADTWSMQASMDKTTNAALAGFGESQLKAVVDKARAGIGVAAS